MGGQVPLSSASVVRQESMQKAMETTARQVDTKNTQTEESEDVSNPLAAARWQARLTRFQPLSSRRRSPSQEGAKKIKGVQERTEGEDLAHSYHHRNEELEAEVLRKLKEDLEEVQDADIVLDTVLGAVKDPTLADEALDYLVESLEGNAREAVLNAKHYLNTVHKKDVVAGRNIDKAAKEFQKTKVGSATELRNLYREIITEPKDHNALFIQLSEKYRPFENLTKVVSFLLKGMGFDLKSKGPSIDPPELKRLMTEVRNLQSIVSVYQFFEGRESMIKKLYEKHHCTNETPPNFEQLSNHFIALVKEPYPSVSKLLAWGKKQGLSENAQIIIFEQFRDAVRNVSPRAFRTPQHKDDLLMTIIQTVESLEPEDEE